MEEKFVEGMCQSEWMDALAKLLGTQSSSLSSALDHSPWDTPEKTVDLLNELNNHILRIEEELHLIPAPSPLRKFPTKQFPS